MADPKKQQTIEFITAILLSLGGAATTYCSFQATVWGGRQAAAFNRADQTRTEAAQIAGRAGQLTLIDVTVFVAWLQAEAGGQRDIERAIRDRLRPEFKAAFDQWRAMDPLHNPNAPATPFTLLSYESAARMRSDELSDDANAFFTRGLYANAQADRYLLATVIFGLALFFAGIGHLFERFAVQVMMLVLSMALLGFGVSRLAALPHATPEPLPEGRAPANRGVS
jgi:hypothetical protein